MKEEILAVIEKLRPTLQGDGGELEFVGITDDGTVIIRMTGLCSTCTAALWTHRLRIERAIREVMPDLKVIIQVK